MSGTGRTESRASERAPRGFEASLRDVRAAKVLSEATILAEGIGPRQLDAAIQQGIIVAVERRFSLDDLEAIRRLAERGSWLGVVAGPRRLAPPVRN